MAPLPLQRVINRRVLHEYLRDVQRHRRVFTQRPASHPERIRRLRFTAKLSGAQREPDGKLRQVFVLGHDDDRVLYVRYLRHVRPSPPRVAVAAE